MNEEWIRPRKLSQLLRQKRREWVAHEPALRPGLVSGRIKAKAASASIEGLPPRSSKTREEDWAIPAKAWEASGDSSAFSLRHDYYNATVHGLPFRRIKCEGLSFELSGIIDVCELDSGDEVETGGLLDLAEYASTFADEVARSEIEVSSAAWLSFPEALVWVISRDSYRVGLTRAWLRYRRLHGKPVEGHFLETFFVGERCEQAEQKISSALLADGAGRLRCQGRNANRQFREITSAEWLGRKVWLRGEIYMGPDHDHRFVEFCDLVFAREDLLRLFPAAADRSMVSPARPPARVSQDRVEDWFREVRCPLFLETSPPTWKDCWEAAKAHFQPDKVVREVLQKARREAAPAHWQKTGPGRDA